MNTVKQLFKGSICATLALAALACNKDDDNDTRIPLGNTAYLLGVGVSTAEATTNYVVPVQDLMGGTISLINNGMLQQGYRDYAQAGRNFYSIGGLGVTDVNTYYADGSWLGTKTGLNFVEGVTDAKDLDGTGKSLLAVAVPANATAGTAMTFVTVDAASNAITRTETVPINNASFPIGEEWILHTGIAVRGNQAFQTFLPFDGTGWATNHTDKAYVAVYSYPDFELEKVIEDGRTGPAGAFGTRSGIFATESGDIYTVSHSGYGYSQRTKEPAILKIAAGTTVFDSDYLFRTADVANGGRIVHALYVGNNKLFASVSTGTQASQWADDNLKFAIVDLAAKTITAVAGSPTFSGNGGRSFAAFHENGKAYAAATVAGVLNVYEIDVAAATLRKGAQVDASFVGGLGRIK